MRSVSVKLPNRSYNIIVSAGAVANLEDHLAAAGLKPPFLVISQPRVFKAVGQGLRKTFPVVLIPEGERAKSLTTVSRVLDRIAALKLTRQSTVVALGGGVVGDVAGFAASIYMRGIAVVQVPTTLLAQVDSSIGGKTGVNLRVGKNLVGTFHQPSLVLADPLVLGKLPDREFSSGLYEALKYGVIRDAELFEDFERNVPLFLKRDAEAIERLVAGCAAIKAEVVMADEKEENVRRILNFGHTIGHAIETAVRYQRIKHGEAVAYGMIAAARIASAMQKLSLEDAARIDAAVHSIGKLPALNGVNSKTVLAGLQHDKKVRDGAVHFVLPRTIGQVEITKDVPLEIVRDVIKRLLDEAKRVPRAR